ncbi:GNAT superfamily N-acetyltransferase [Micromonospora polyrhachis]|uniref:GNAT superfamily N-acetyltransferase n=1 Tax=Micromonospora polyrhachis TaxID=1282883 RepID=A0A7W7SPM4_9ACTN|nr:GNAT superfamily N-acetyltransferase [Micromonospora polyrhachis]
MVAIRLERPDDALAIAGVHVRAWQAGYAGIMPAEVLDRLNVAAWAQRRRERGTAEPEHPFRTLVATADDSDSDSDSDSEEIVVGFATVGPYRTGQDPEDLDHRYGEILTMYVEPTRWGTGIGRALLAAAVTELAGRGWTELRLWVLAENSRGRRFYERAGLAPDGDRTVFRLQWSRGRPPVGLVELRYAARLSALATTGGRGPISDVRPVDGARTVDGSSSPATRTDPIVER